MDRIIAERLLLLRLRLLEIAKAGGKARCQVPWDGVQDVGFKIHQWIDTGCGEHFCGTSACVLGHAALMPEFQELGLDVEMGARYGLLHPAPVGVMFGKHTDYDAGKAFFNLTAFEANALFLTTESHSSYNTPDFRAGVIVSLIRMAHPDLVVDLPGAPDEDEYFHTVVHLMRYGDDSDYETIPAAYQSSEDN